MDCNYYLLKYGFFFFTNNNFEVLCFIVSIFSYSILSLYSIYLITLVTSYFANSDDSVLINY